MLKQLLSLFLESKCPLCDRTAKDTICIYCQRKLSSYRLDRPNLLGTGELPLFAWGKYDGQLKRAIAVMKYDRQPDIGLVLGKWLGKAWIAHSVVKQKNISVVPLPIHPDKQQSRGFNQAEIIAKGFCRQTGYLLQPEVLLKVRNTKAMFGLNALERKQNISNAFQIGTETPKYPILFIDDIHTSGNTVMEATKVLTRQGINVIGVAVVAKAGKPVIKK